MGNSSVVLQFPAPAREADAVIIGKIDRTTVISFRNFPLLVMNKIGIEHLPKNDSKRSKPTDVTEACLNVQKQLELIQAENGLLQTTMNDLRV
nr:uncharacterized protein LOC109182314 [Ipomoea trifida]